MGVKKEWRGIWRVEGEDGATEGEKEGWRRRRRDNG